MKLIKSNQSTRSFKITLLIYSLDNLCIDVRGHLVPYYCCIIANFSFNVY